MMRTIRPTIGVPSLLASFWLAACTGCGTFAVDDGLYPLPAIHLVFPLPSNVGLAYEDVHLTAANGQTLYGWFIPASEPRATVLVHHGAVANRSSGLSHYRLLHDLGCNVFAYDYQGFGESWCLATLATILPDADVALGYLQGRDQPDPPPIIIFGASLGTVPAFAQAARSPAGVVGVIAEGSCVPQNLSSYAFALMGMIPSPEAFLSFPGELSPEANVPLITLPKLFIHSPADSVSPIAGALTLYEAAVEPKQFAEVSGEHLLAIEFDADNYRSIISSFLDQILSD